MRLGLLGRSVRFVCYLGVVALAACEGGVAPDPTAVAWIEVTPAQASLARPGEAVQFAGVGVRIDGTPDPDASFRWASSDPAVAIIDADGLAEAIARGTTTITATSQGLVGVATLRIDPDTVPPSLVAVRIDQTRVEVFNTPKVVQVEIVMEDDRSGVSSVTALFRSPSGAPVTGIVTLSGVVDATISGLFEGFLAILPGSAPGRWTLSTILAEDSEGNEATWNEIDLEALGLLVTFEVLPGRGAF